MLTRRSLEVLFVTAISLALLSDPATGATMRTVDVEVDAEGVAPALPFDQPIEASRNVAIPVDEVPIPIREAQAAGLIIIAAENEGLRVGMAGVATILYVEWPRSAAGEPVSDGSHVFLAPLLEFDQDSADLVDTGDYMYETEGQARLPFLPDSPAGDTSLPHARLTSRIDPESPFAAVTGTLPANLEIASGRGIRAAPQEGPANSQEERAASHGFDTEAADDLSGHLYRSGYFEGDGPAIGPSSHKTTGSGSTSLPDPDARVGRGLPLVPLVGTAALILLLGPVILYHRIRTNEALENGTRKRIHDMIVENPGVSIQGAARLADVSHSTATYHMERLVQAGMVLRVRDGNKVRYYKNGGAFTETERKFLPLTKSKGTMKVLSRLLSEPDAYRAKLASELGLSTATVNWHLKRLFECGLVEESRDGRHRFLRADGEKVSGTVAGLKTKVGPTSDVSNAEEILGLLRKAKDQGSEAGASSQ